MKYIALASTHTQDKVRSFIALILVLLACFWFMFCPANARAEEITSNQALQMIMKKGRLPKGPYVLDSLVIKGLTKPVIDLSGVEFGGDLTFEDCRINKLDLTEANANFNVSLLNCEVGEFNGGKVQIGDLLFIKGSKEIGMLDLARAKVGETRVIGSKIGEIDISQGELREKPWIELSLEDSTIISISGFFNRGMVRLKGTQVTGNILCPFCELFFTNPPDSVVKQLIGQGLPVYKSVDYWKIPGN